MDQQMVSLMTNHATIINNQQEIERALSHQHRCIELLKAEVTDIKVIIAEIRDLLAAMHVFSGVIKYVAIVGAAVLSAWHAVRTAWKMFWS